MRRVLFGLFLSLSVAAAACGDEEEDKTTGDAGSGSGADAAVNACAPGPSVSYGSCTSAQVSEYSSCVETSCKSQYETCYGPNYKTGSFSGACSDYITCTNKCNCNDTACYQGCTRSAECSTCMMGFASCSGSCISKLGCALGDAGSSFLGDGGVSFDKTCDDLLTCCNSLSDATKKAQCTQVHTQASASAAGNTACSVVISTYCP